MGDLEKTTLKSIAGKLGISVSTVSRVLSGKARQYRISQKTEELVQKKADQLGFAPDQIASSLRLKRTRTLGLLIPDISNSYFASVARAVENEARNRGYSIILTDSQENEKIEMESIRLLKSRNVDGLIIAPVGQIGDYLETLHAGGLPIVLIDRYFPQVNLPFVTSDNYKGAFEATDYLIGKGHRKIACIQGLPDTSTNRDRVSGFRDALIKYKIEPDEELITGSDFSENNGYVEAKRLLGNHHNLTAIFSLGNLCAFGVIRALKEEGLTIPGDISLVSFDDHYYSPFLATPLTAVAQQMDKIGQAAVQLFCDQLDNPYGGKTSEILLSTQLNERSSVRDLNIKTGTEL
jgi:LacI family transcriptional regulator